MLKRHNLITLPWISVTFLFKAEFQPGLRAKFFSNCVYAKASFQTPWAGAACKLSGKKYWYPEATNRASCIAKCADLANRLFSLLKEFSCCVPAKQIKQALHQWLLYCSKTWGFPADLNKGYSIVSLLCWLFLHLFFMYKVQVLRMTSRHPISGVFNYQ